MPSTEVCLRKSFLVLLSGISKLGSSPFVVEHDRGLFHHVCLIGRILQHSPVSRTSREYCVSGAYIKPLVALQLSPPITQPRQVSSQLLPAICRSIPNVSALATVKANH